MRSAEFMSSKDHPIQDILAYLLGASAVVAGVVLACRTPWPYVQHLKYRDCQKGCNAYHTGYATPVLTVLRCGMPRVVRQVRAGTNRSSTGSGGFDKFRATRPATGPTRKEERYQELVRNKLANYLFRTDFFDATTLHRQCCPNKTPNYKALLNKNTKQKHYAKQLCVVPGALSRRSVFCQAIKGENNSQAAKLEHIKKRSEPDRSTPP